MMTVPDLAALVYRADWTRLSLSATVTWSRDPAVDLRLLQRKMSVLRQLLEPIPKVGIEPGWEHHYLDTLPRNSECRLLVAPGGRYRVEASDGSLVSVCDGEHSWQIDAGGGEAERARAAGPDLEFRGLVTPQWLVACYDLEIVGNEMAQGRPAVLVLGRPRAIRLGNRGWSPGGRYDFLDRVEVLVDAELGIVVRSEQIFEGQPRETAELRDLIIDPAEAAETGKFAPPPGLPVTDDRGPGWHASGPGWQLAGAAAGLAASAMGFAIRHAPRPRKTSAPGDDEAEMPGDAWLAAADWDPRQPPGDELINLLLRTGLPAQDIAAELHHWLDIRALVGRVNAVRAQTPASLDGIMGPDAVWDAAGDLAREYGTVHKVARLRVSTPGRYRLDHLAGDWGKRYAAIAADGEHTTKLFADRVTTGPARPLEATYAAMVDPAWLLSGWRLTAAGPASVGGRAGHRLLAQARSEPVSAHNNMCTRMEVVVDAELGILLRQTGYVGEQPAMRTELRNLTLRDGETAGEFRIEPEPGMRSAADSGGALADLDLPRPAEVVGTAATLAIGGAIAGAVAVTGWLDKHRARRDQR